MTTYAISGIGGKFGRQAANYLLDSTDEDDQLIGLARRVEKAKQVAPDNFEIRPGDLADYDQLVASLKGVERLLFISSLPGQQVARVEQHQNLINAAKAAGVQFIAYTSFPNAGESRVPLAQDHRATEQLLQESGIAHSFLRNNWYLENELGVLKAARDGRPFIYSAGAGKVGWALEREYAEGAVQVLVSQTPKEVYEFGGPLRTYAELARAFDNEFPVEAVNDEEYTKSLIADGVPAQYAPVYTSFQKLIRDGELAVDSTDLVDVLGHELTNLSEAIGEVLRNQID